jgi:hypothetical protein
VRYLAEEKEGRVKLTVEMEINETLMEIIKEGMAKIPEMMAQQAKKE